MYGTRATATTARPENAGIPARKDDAVLDEELPPPPSTVFVGALELAGGVVTADKAEVVVVVGVEVTSVRYGVMLVIVPGEAVIVNRLGAIPGHPPSVPEKKKGCDQIPSRCLTTSTVRRTF